MTKGTMRPSDRVALAATIDPDVYSAAAHVSDYVAMADFEKIMAVACAGTLGGGATFDAKLVQATNGSGAGSKDIAEKSIVQLTQAGTDDSDKQAIINCIAEELDVNGGFTHVALVITIGAASSDAGGQIFGLNARYSPGSDHDLASVTEIVS